MIGWQFVSADIEFGVAKFSDGKGPEFGLHQVGEIKGLILSSLLI